MTRALSAASRHISPIDEILAARQANQNDMFATRYGEGRREQREREQIRESYLAIDIRLRSGEYRGMFYFDLAGSPRLDKDHTTLVVPFREEKLIIRGYRLLEVYRSILHHSLDILEETHRPEFVRGDEPVVESIEIIEEREEQ